MEYVGGGSLLMWIIKSMPVALELVRHYARETLDGLRYLHEKDIVHGDLRVSYSLTLCFLDRVLHFFFSKYAGIFFSLFSYCSIWFILCSNLSRLLCTMFWLA